MLPPTRGELSELNPRVAFMLVLPPAAEDEAELRELIGL